MKPFHEWAAEQAGSIEDPNTWANEPKRTVVTNNITKKRTKWQIRSDFADLVAGVPHNRKSVILWVEIFSSSIDPSMGYSSPTTDARAVLGDVVYNDYVKLSASDPDADLLWWAKMYGEIHDGTFAPPGGKP